MQEGFPIVNGVSCQDCGVCCQHMGHPRFAQMADAALQFDPYYARLPDVLKNEVDSYLKDLPEDNWGAPCIWLDQTTKLCRHHEHRPQICRDFEVGGEDCRRVRKKLDTPHGSQQNK